MNRRILISILAVLMVGIAAAAEEPADAHSLSIAFDRFTPQSSAVEGNREWELDVKGRIATVLEFPEDGLYTFIVLLRAAPGEATWPTATAAIDYRPVFTTPVNTTNWGSYTFVSEVTQGTREFSISFDRSGPEAQGILYAAGVTVISAPDVPIVSSIEAAAAETGSDRVGRWKESSDEQIRRLRRGALTVWVVEPDGRPAPDATVSVRQTGHEFLFGAVLSPNAFGPADTNEQVAAYRDFVAKRFNCASAGRALDWALTEPAPGANDYRIATSMASWCRNRELPLRGGPIFQGCETPTWAAGLSDRDLEDALRRRAEDVAGRFRTQIDELDFLRDPLDCPQIEERLGSEILGALIERARSVNPSVVAYVSDAGLLGGEATDRFVNYVRGQMERGARIGGVGLLAHLANRIEPSAVTRRLDTLAQLSLPIKVVEFRYIGTNETIHARCLENVLIAAFSHPSVEGFLVGDVWAESETNEVSTLARNDFTLTEAGETFDLLVRDRWWTATAGKSDRVGRYTCDAYFGNYEIEATTPDGRAAKAVVSLSRAFGEASVSIHLPAPDKKPAAKKAEKKPKAANDKKPDAEFSAPVPW